MAKKNFKNAEMENLLAGLANSQEPQHDPGEDDGTAEEEKKVNAGSKVSKGKKVHITANMSPELVAKIRAMAYKEGLKISDIINVAVGNLISAYEKKYGTLKINTGKADRSNKLEKLLEL